MTRSIYILSTADFNADVWTNKQHLAVRLAAHMPVTYIESLGLRRPTTSRSDLRRILERIKRNTKEGKPANHNGSLRLMKPHVVPLHANPIIQAVNTVTLSRQVWRHVQQEKQTPILWTFSPVTYGIERHFSKVVYHSVDLLHTLPHMPADLILDSERHILNVADHVIASSRGVQRHLQSVTDVQVRLWENVADTETYVNQPDQRRKSRVVFAGNITNSKIDFSLLHEVAATGAELVLAGPMAIDGTNASRELADLLRRPNVSHAGNLAPPQLAELLNTCTVGIIPYNLNDYTAGVFPMKVYEYLASGLTVVSTRLPSLEKVDDSDIHVMSKTEFKNAVIKYLNADYAEIERRKQRAKKHSWTERTNDAMKLLVENWSNAN